RFLGGLRARIILHNLLITLPSLGSVAGLFQVASQIKLDVRVCFFLFGLGLFEQRLRFVARLGVGVILDHIAEKLERLACFRFFGLIELQRSLGFAFNGVRCFGLGVGLGLRNVLALGILCFGVFFRIHLGHSLGLGRAGVVGSHLRIDHLTLQ